MDGARRRLEVLVGEDNSGQGECKSWRANANNANADDHASNARPVQASENNY
jgi:hypothetical protein